jgi:hypothetical protein
MKQWLYYGWYRFKDWVLFNYWKFVSDKDDAEELLKLYRLKRWEQRAMKAYVEHINGRKYKELEDWYVGTINPEKMMNATLEKKDE